jgi:hypothetical protein
MPNETTQTETQPAATPPAATAKPQSAPDVTFNIGKSGQLEAYVPASKNSAPSEPNASADTKPAPASGPENIDKRLKDTRDDWLRMKAESDQLKAKLESLSLQNQQLLTHVATQQQARQPQQQNAPLSDDQIAELQSDPRKMMAFIGAYANALVEQRLSRVMPTIQTIEERLQFEKAAGATPGYESYIPDMVKAQNAVADKFQNVPPSLLFEIVKAIKGEPQSSGEAAATGSQQTKREPISEADIRNYINRHSTEGSGVSTGDRNVDDMPAKTIQQAFQKALVMHGLANY